MNLWEMFYFFFFFCVCSLTWTVYSRSVNAFKATSAVLFLSALIGKSYHNEESCPIFFFHEKSLSLCVSSWPDDAQVDLFFHSGLHGMLVRIHLSVLHEEHLANDRLLRALQHLGCGREKGFFLGFNLLAKWSNIYTRLLSPSLSFFQVSIWQENASMFAFFFSQMEKHKQECPKQIVKCFYNPMGCHFEVCCCTCTFTDPDFVVHTPACLLLLLKKN